MSDGTGIDERASGHDRRAEFNGLGTETARRWRAQWTWRDAGASVPPDAAALDGSWYVQLCFDARGQRSNLRGVLRIEARDDAIEASGDLYAAPDGEPGEVIARDSLIIGSNWYPQLDLASCRFVLHSIACTFEHGVLEIDYWIHEWTESSRAGAGRLQLPRRGLARLRLDAAPRTHPALERAGLAAPTRVMFGTAEVRGRTYLMAASKTSPHYRGCRIDVEVMERRRWRESVATPHGPERLDSVFRRHGLDVDLRVHPDSIPYSESVDYDRLQSIYDGTARPVPDHVWQLTLMVLSHAGPIDDGLNARLYGRFRTLPDRATEPDRARAVTGIMFDVGAYGAPPFRQAAALFSDRTLNRKWHMTAIDAGSANLRFGAVDIAFLRLALHEAGHALGLPHSADSWSIMSQTGLVVDATLDGGPRFPFNVRFEFDEYSRKRLTHAPDLAIAPRFNDLGRLSVRKGRVNPVAYRFRQPAAPPVPALELCLHGLPDKVARGRLVLVEIAIRNHGQSAAPVPGTLALAPEALREDDAVHLPAEGKLATERRPFAISATRFGDDLRAVQEDLALSVHVVADATTRRLEPGATLRQWIPVLCVERTAYDSQFAFGAVGAHELQAALEFDRGRFVRSRIHGLELYRPRRGTREATLTEVTNAAPFRRAVARGHAVDDDERAALTSVVDGFGDEPEGVLARIVRDRGDGFAPCAANAPAPAGDRTGAVWRTLVDALDGVQRIESGRVSPPADDDA